ncbi:hypothetical protein LUZ60_008044 [Juncus effusus]|nr:hypothetical protein LUZ60_008044 [Juncus effusus]
MVRAKKKQKRLDAITDLPSPASPSSASLRRSHRDRRAPAVLDSSPVPSPRKKRPHADLSPPSSPDLSAKPRKEVFFGSNDGDGDGDGEGWRDRLRGRDKGKDKMKSKKKKKKKKSKVRTTKRKDRTDESQEVSKIPESGGEDCSAENEKSKSLQEIENQQNNDTSDTSNSSQNELNEDRSNQKEDSLEPKDVIQCEISASKDQIENPIEQKSSSPVPPQNPTEEAQSSPVPPQKPTEEEQSSPVPPLKPTEQQQSSPNPLQNPNPQPNPNKPLNSEPSLKEFRKCGLCMGGTDGKPPKILPHPDSVDSENNESYKTLNPNSNDESNYDALDGFGSEPGWLGRLLGPIRDRIGIARIWVHQNCAVWSPEVYFAGPGYLKSIRAALYRGKSLKCSRCGRPGATIGCRVDRCPKTYHLPCSRAVNCIFDHRKFLIACADHRHLFEPQGPEKSHHLKKLKLKKLRADLKKRSSEARKQDLDLEEKWLEGEDEEFLKRENKRLHRDVLRLNPTFIGNNENDESNKGCYEGWESVAGLKDVINCMKEVVILPLLYPEIFTSLNLDPPKGVLLHGYPGTGKTLIVRALIGALSRGDKKIAYFARKGADCLGKYVGDSERQLRLLFQLAEKSQPSIIFFDEIDGLAPCRSKRQDQTHNSVVATLLSLMDGLKSRGSVIVIGSTNRPESVDPALRRPGRFDREIYFPLPSKEDRVSILNLHTKNWPNYDDISDRNVRNDVISYVADRTVDYSGADLQSICAQTVVNALKRSFDMREVLLKAELGFFNSGVPELPRVRVEERDWIEALMSAPPPCARRVAGGGIADVSGERLEEHLMPVLLRDLCLFLVWIVRDERVWLPCSILKCGLVVKDVIFEELGRNNVDMKLWNEHVCNMVEKEDVRDEIVRVLSKFGLISSRIETKEVEFDVDNDEYVGYNKKLLGFNDKLLGFRALIGGTHGSGQQKLASCLINGFLGQIEIIKINLATMSLEGNGDIISGLTQILLKCVNLRRCVIYMPRIDLWAVDRIRKVKPDMNDDVSGDVSSVSEMNADVSSVSEMNDDVSSVSGINADVSGDVSRVSEIWSAFVEQVDSACTSNSTIILATSEIQCDDLPLTIQKFFNTNSSNSFSIPRFSLNLDGKFNPNEVLNSFASKLSHDLIQTYIQLIHQASHTNNLPQIDLQFPQKTEIEKENPNPIPKVEIPKKSINNNNNNITIGAISSIGYQILVYPQFSELCYVTSKLKEGPCTDIKGPWKGWPFSSCIIRTGSTGTSSTGTGTKSQSNIVRGLVAVGLLAYKGVYSSINEVCFEVRRVLELLAMKIQIRVLEGKDPYLYFRVLTQMAYLEDMVMNWAYSFKRTYGESRMAEPSAKPTIHEKIQIENCAQNDEIQTNEANNNNNPNELNENNRNESKDNNPIDNISPKEVENNSPNEVPVQDNDHEMHEASDNTVQDNDLKMHEANDSIVQDNNDHNMHEANDSTVPEEEFQNQTHESEITEPVPMETQEIRTGTETGIETGTETGTETIFVSREKDSCMYACCSDCFDRIHSAVSEAISKFWKAHLENSRVDDMHDIITTYALNIVTMVTKKHASQSDLEMFAARECEFHFVSDGEKSEEKLSFWFKDGVLMPSNVGLSGEKFHCDFRRLCLCPILDMVKL